MRVNREALLNELEQVTPGLSNREVSEQSSCFIFQDGIVTTFNDEVCCSHKTILPFTGAIQAAPLLSLLGKLPQDEIDVEVKDGEMRIVASRKKGSSSFAGLRMEEEILTPIDSIEEPTKWKVLDDDFLDAIHIVQECAGKDQQEFAMTCVHIHRDYVEACDNYQVARYPVKTGIKTECLVRKDSIKHISELLVDEMCQTETWLHFRNPKGLIFSCRTELQDYQDVSPIIEMDGSPATLPKGLSEACEKAEIFSSETPDNNQVMVELKEGMLRLTGEGISGWYKETRKIKYKGPRLKFLISPKLLTNITQRHRECKINNDRLKVDGGKFVYVTCLGRTEKEEE